MIYLNDSVPLIYNCSVCSRYTSAITGKMCVREREREREKEREREREGGRSDNFGKTYLSDSVPLIYSFSICCRSACAIPGRM